VDLAEFRRRLAHAPSPAGSVYGDDGAAEREAAGVTPAAVLVAVIDHPDGPTVLFTRRTAHLKAHSGQISFPGGRAEPDDPSVEFTALREAQEEIGLPPDKVEVILALPEYFTRTGFRVTPVVGVVRPPLELVPDAREVDEIFEVPLGFLLDPVNHRRASRVIGERTAHFYEIEHNGRVIWGATAGMLVNLYRMLA
jgi:8-oxo-dGTP pyrophosphatase MutT (NUDIX family)